jgi:hypothetical protein
MKNSPVYLPNYRNLFIALAIIFLAPFTGLIISIFDLALAPPWTFLSSSLVPLLSCISIPTGLIFLITQKLNGWIKFVLALLFFLAPVVTLVLYSINPIITGMTNCQSLPAQPPQVRYQCESTSSDDTDFSYKFILEGRDRFPIMRVVEP